MQLRTGTEIAGIGTASVLSQDVVSATAIAGYARMRQKPFINLLSIEAAVSDGSSVYFLQRHKMSVEIYAKLE